MDSTVMYRRKGGLKMFDAKLGLVISKCSQETLHDVFPERYKLSSHCSVGLDKSYIVFIDLKSDSNVAVGLSNSSVAIFDKGSVVKKTTFKAHSKKLTGDQGFYSRLYEALFSTASA